MTEKTRERKEVELASILAGFRIELKSLTPNTIQNTRKYCMVGQLKVADEECGSVPSVRRTPDTKTWLVINA